MSIDASAINEIFDMFPYDDPNPSEVLDELKQVKTLLEEWEEADDYIDAPEELINHLYELRNEVDDEKERVEELENEVMKLQSPETHAQLMDDYVENYLDDQGIRKPFSDVVDDYIKLKDQFEAIEQSTEASAYNELIIQDLTKKVEELEEKVEDMNWEDITMDHLTTAEEEGDETLEEYVKRRIDKYILEGSLFTSDAVEEAYKSLEFVRNTLTEPIQEAVPPS